MFRRFLLAVGLAGVAYQLYNNASPESKNKVSRFIQRASGKMNFRDWLSVFKK